MTLFQGIRSLLSRAFEQKWRPAGRGCNRSQGTVPIFAVYRENGTVPLGGEGDRHIFRPKRAEK